MLELWGVRSTPSFSSLPDPDRVLSLDQIELFDIKTECKQITYAKLNCFEIELFGHLTVCKQIAAV